MKPDLVSSANWLSLIRRYGLITMAANLAWESAHVPLYTIWTDRAPLDIAFSVLHCMAGDIAITFVCLVLALSVLGHPEWPIRRFKLVATAATLLGVSYTIYSERLYLETGGWAYSDAMPIVPPFGTGLSPLFQWIVIPLVGFFLARRRVATGGN